MNWPQAKKILCVRLDSLGDVLMTGPALRALKQPPGRSLTLLTSPSGAPAAAMMPEIDAIRVFAAPWMKSTLASEDAAADTLVAWLRKERFDAAVVFTVHTQTPMPSLTYCHLGRIPLRLAYVRERVYGLLTHALDDPDVSSAPRHEVRRQLDLVASVGCFPADERLQVSVPPAARARAEDFLQRLGLASHRCWVVFHPGASAPSRRYPAAQFAKAARELVARHGFQVLFTGSTQEQPLVTEIMRAMEAPSHSLAGALDAAELAVVLERAPALVVNNTGPAHLAAAVGTPVVCLYALTNVQHTPWGVEARTLFHDVECRFCLRSTCPEGHQNCLQLVPPERVVQAAVELAALPHPALRPTIGTGQDAALALLGKRRSSCSR